MGARNHYLGCSDCYRVSRSLHTPFPSLAVKEIALHCNSSCGRIRCSWRNFGGALRNPSVRPDFRRQRRVQLACGPVGASILAMAGKRMVRHRAEPSGSPAAKRTWPTQCVRAVISRVRFDRHRSGASRDACRCHPFNQNDANVWDLGFCPRLFRHRSRYSLPVHPHSYSGDLGSRNDGEQNHAREWII